MAKAKKLDYNNPPTYPKLQTRGKALGVKSGAGWVQLKAPARSKHINELALLGTKLRKATNSNPPSKRTLATLTKHAIAGDSKRFASAYRGVDKGKDEIVATQQVFHFANGIAKNPATHKEFLPAVLSAMSAARVPTGSAGHNSALSVMQHPTSNKSTFWGSPGQGHPLHDRVRADAALHQVESDTSLGAAGAPHALIIASATAHTNTFSGPTSALNQHPKAGVSGQKRKAADDLREDIKDIAAGSSKRPKQPASAKWEPKHTSRSPSPSRR